MAEIITESFCERCGTRYTFEAAIPKKRRIGKLKVLSKGLKNYVLSEDASLDEALAEARSEEQRELTGGQLEAFHQTFQFCMSCRQYTCANCWNEAEGRCLSCAPLAFAGSQLRSPLDDMLAGGGMSPLLGQPSETGLAASNGNGHAELGATEAAPLNGTAWPTIDLFRAPEPEAVAEPVEAVAEPVEAVAEPVEAVAEPVEAVAEPVEAVAEPVEAVAEPVEAVAEPVEAVAEPVEAVAEPVEAVAEPVEAVAEPVEAVAEPVEAVAEPVEAVAEPVEAVAEPEDFALSSAAEFWMRPFTGVTSAPESTNGHNQDLDAPGASVEEPAAPPEAVERHGVVAAEAAPPEAVEPAEAAPSVVEPVHDRRAEELAAHTSRLLGRLRAQPPGARTPARVDAPAPEPAQAPAPAAPAVDIVEVPSWPVTDGRQPAAADGAAAPALEPAVPAPPAPAIAPTPPVAPSPAWTSRPAGPTEAPQWPAPLRPVVDVSVPPFWASGDLNRATRDAGLWTASAQEVIGATDQPAPQAGVQSCVRCGLSLSATARFCRRCGSSQV